MKRILLILTVLLLLGVNIDMKAQTLAAGDIVILGISADAGPASPGGDEFSWMSLVNLNAGTVIYFTDAGWNSNAGSVEFMGAGESTEGLYKYTTPAGGLLAGVPQTVAQDMTLGSASGNTIPGTGTYVDYQIITGTKCGARITGPNLPNGGDQVIAFRTSLAPTDPSFGSSGTFTALFAVTDATLDWASANGLTSSFPTGAARTNVSNLPPGLTNGTNAVAVGMGNLQMDEADNVRYEGPISGSKAVLLAAFATRVPNWKRYDATAGAEAGDLVVGAVPTGWTRNGVAGNFTVTGSDNILPVCQSIILSGSPAANSASVSFIVTFDETVTNVSTDDFTVATITGNATGTVSAISGSGASYTLTVNSITGTGSFRLNLKSNTNIIDSFNNGNNNNGFVAAYTSGSTHTADRDNPTISITSLQSNPTNASPITVNITFSESVSGFTLGDIGIGNGSASVLSGGGSSYSVAITPAANGTVTVSIGGSVATDAAGNGNNAASNFTITSDRSSPSVSITSGVSNPTNVNSFSVNVNFSESVTGFAQSDITAGNASLGSFSGSGSSYSVTVTPSADGLVTLNIGANAATDSATNGNTAATQFSTNVDRSVPSVSMTSATSATTNSNPIPVTVTFSESVTGFIAGDIVPSNATVANFSGSGANYTFNLVPSGNGTVTANIAGAVATDGINGNSAASQFSRTFDPVSPTVTMTPGTTSPTNATDITVAITFSEDVTGFTSSDISVGNGSIGSLNTNSASSYTLHVTPSAAGTVTVNIVGGIAFDAANNGNTAATQYSIVYDNTQPALVINSVTTSPTNSNSIPLTFTFNETVTGFISSDITVGNGSISGFSGSGSNYTATLTPSGAGTVTVNVGAGGANDAAGNGNTAASQFSIVYDSSQPSVSITSSAGASTNVNPIPVTITFNEAVANFVQGDISVTNGSISNFSGGTNVTTYTFNLVPSGNGTVTVDVAAGVANDTAGNVNTAATQLSRIYDATGPTLIISAPVSNPTNANTIALTFTFSEDVSGFDAGDITASGGSISGFSATNASVYTATLTPSGDGTLNIFVFQSTSTDSAGNGNSFASYSTVSDRTSPTVVISSPQTSPTSNSPFTININFSEAVTGFDVTDIAVTGGGSFGTLSGSGASYTVNFTPSGNGQKSFNIAANKANDAAGNNNTAAAQFNMTYAPACSSPRTWNGFFWSPSDPVADQPAVIAADYPGDFGTPADIAACSLTVGNNAHVILGSGFKITITGNATVQAGSTMTLAGGSNFIVGGNLIAQPINGSTPAAVIVFENNANLIQSGTINNNSGTITYRRDALMRRLDYVYWSTPVSGQNLKAFSPQTVSPPVGASRFYTFNEPGNNFAVIPTPEATTMAAAQGYMVRAPNNYPVDGTQQTFNGTFTGTPNNGNYSIPVTVSAGQGYNMIGNPYPSPIDADLFLATNPGTLYFWTHVDQNAGSAANYATYTTVGTAAGSGGETPNGTIQAGQGFMLQRTTAGTASFTNAMRVGNNDGQFFRTANNDKSRIWLNLSSESAFMNQMLVGYMEGATNSVDESIDGKLIDNSSTTLSNLINEEAYTIQGRPMPFENTDVVALNFKAATSGTYTIAIDHVDGLFSEDQPIFIKDNLTGIVHNIKESNYSFASVEGNFANRFEIVFQNATLGTENPVLTANGVIVYDKNGILNINAGNMNMKDVKIFDMRGRLIYEKDNIHATATSIDNLKAEQQVLLVQVVSDDNKTVTKKVVY